MAHTAATELAKTLPSEINRPAPESEETALSMAKLFAEQWEVKFPLAFLIADVWYVYPNETTVSFAYSLEEATKLSKPPVI